MLVRNKTQTSINYTHAIKEEWHNSEMTLQKKQKHTNRWGTN